MNTVFIKYIQAIKNEGNVSRASKVLFISQPALLKTLNNLEHSLGAALFIRDKRRMILTEAGKVFLKRGENILKQEEALYSEINALNEGRSGIITLGIPGDRGASLLPIIQPKFQALYPNFRLKTVENHSSELEHLLLSGAIDLALHTLPIDENLFKYENLSNDFIVVGASRKSAFAKQFNLDKNSIHSPYLIDPKLLKNCEFLLVKPGRGTRRIADYIFEKNNISPKIYQEYDRHQTLVKMCALGEQLCITPCISPITLGIDKDMCFFTTQKPLVNRHIIISYVKNKTLTPVEQQLISIAREAAQQANKPAEKIKIVTDYMS